MWLLHSKTIRKHKYHLSIYLNGAATKPTSINHKIPEWSDEQSNACCLLMTSADMRQLSSALRVRGHGSTCRLSPTPSLPPWCCHHKFDLTSHPRLQMTWDDSSRALSLTHMLSVWSATLKWANQIWHHDYCIKQSGCTIYMDKPLLCKRRFPERSPHWG